MYPNICPSPDCVSGATKHDSLPQTSQPLLKYTWYSYIYPEEVMLTLRCPAVCEEVYNASTVVPWAIIATIMVNGVMGLALLIAILFCLGNIDAALNTPTDSPSSRSLTKLQIVKRLQPFCRAWFFFSCCGFKRDYGHCFSSSLVIRQR